MSWFKRSSPELPVEMRVPKVEFVGEQDGLPEQLLKDRLIDFFQRDKSVQNAYLAKVSIGNQPGVALCLKTESGPNRVLVEKIGVVFKTIFNAHEHLDIMFLNPLQEIEVAQACRPFWWEKRFTGRAKSECN